MKGSKNPNVRTVKGYGKMVDKLRRLSPKALYNIGNIGLILVQALLFFAANFLAIFSDWCENPCLLKAGVYFAVYVILIFVCMCLYFMAVHDKDMKPPEKLFGLFIVTLIPIAPAVVEMRDIPEVVNHPWWKPMKLLIGTVCQGFAGYIAWKLASLIPTPAAKKNTNEDGEGLA